MPTINMLIPATTHININKVLKEMNVNQTTPTCTSTPRRTKSEFPIKVYAMLELADNIFEFAQAVTWLPHGRAFKIHDKVKFMNKVVPVFFNQTKIRSFNRQLYMWGFRR